jgi:hypothetical protein
MWESRLLTLIWASTACYRDSFNFQVTLDIIYVYALIRRDVGKEIRVSKTNFEIWELELGRGSRDNLRTRRINNYSLCFVKIIANYSSTFQILHIVLRALSVVD